MRKNGEDEPGHNNNKTRKGKKSAVGKITHWRDEEEGEKKLIVHLKILESGKRRRYDRSSRSEQREAKSEVSRSITCFGEKRRNADGGVVLSCKSASAGTSLESHAPTALPRPAVGAAVGELV